MRVNDGERHRVILKRQGKYGSIEVDNNYIVEGHTDGITNKMNCNGNIYLGNNSANVTFVNSLMCFDNIFLGGTPNNVLITGGRYPKGFNGCIHGFEVQDSKMIDLGTKALYGVNVKPCSR